MSEAATVVALFALIGLLLARMRREQRQVHKTTQAPGQPLKSKAARNAG